MIDWVFQHLDREAERILAAPLAFLLFVGVGAILGYTVGAWYYKGRVADLTTRVETVEQRVKDRDAQIERYKVAVGLTSPSVGNLVPLTNPEMRAKAFSVAAKLREFALAFRNESDSLAAGAKDANDRAERSMRLLKDKSAEFDRTLKAESNLVDNELRRRLGREAVASIVGVPASVFSAADGAPLSVLGMMPSGMGMSAMFAGTLADGIEQMGILLPEDPAAPVPPAR